MFSFGFGYLRMQDDNAHFHNTALVANKYWGNGKSLKGFVNHAYSCYMISGNLSYYRREENMTIESFQTRVPIVTLSTADS